MSSVLHPKYKKSYFAKAGWPKNWVETAEELVWDIWVKNYKPEIETELDQDEVRISFLFIIILMYSIVSRNPMILLKTVQQLTTPMMRSRTTSTQPLNPTSKILSDIGPANSTGRMKRLLVTVPWLVWLLISCLVLVRSIHSSFCSII
ncbi:hypothetical protein K435DRAFT_664552 [Dendrothele bispora CBS 962.96]|uniref:Uncharacterized protein n=1 Tax=Dendrothele bispora (strain CBS 962.96) TaxID=1314807 RepID=A0A4S8M2S4_DENBC|nr:hypothetical protein K435DRAFT_664552 [Dendrothele bispora CBS 962.96]